MMQPRRATSQEQSCGGLEVLKTFEPADTRILRSPTKNQMTAPFVGGTISAEFQKKKNI